MPQTKIYRVEARRGRIALGDLVTPGDRWIAQKEGDDVIVLTRVVVVPASSTTAPVGG